MVRKLAPQERNRRKAKMIKVPQQIMTSYDRIANRRPVITVIDQYGKIYAGLSLLILSYDVIIYGRILIISEKSYCENTPKPVFVSFQNLRFLNFRIRFLY